MKLPPDRYGLNCPGKAKHKYELMGKQAERKKQAIINQRSNIPYQKKAAISKIMHTKQISNKANKRATKTPAQLLQKRSKQRNTQKHKLHNKQHA